ncbi:unnamed protein product [Owenia fusiformis]|uniref:Uncharacterized protein n=1 Tax=Owenia fusiformis TaxID=6347 RepID=A0A8J1XZR8_OWEFU|nr:unnamed protein product [Owenia fusiformis]
MWKLTMFALGLLCAVVLLCPCEAKIADTDMEEPAKELSVRGDPTPIAFPGVDAIMDDLNTFTTSFKEFQAMVFSSTIDIIIDFLKMLIILLEALKEKLQAAKHFLNGLPFTGPLVKALEELCKWIEKLLKLLKSLLKAFEALESFFNKLKELLGEAESSSQALGDSSSTPSLSKLFKMLSQVLKEIRTAVFCKCPWPEKLAHFKRLLESIRRLIALKESIMAGLKPSNILYQLLVKLDEYLDQILKYMQNAISQERNIRRSYSQASRAARMIQWCKIPGIICICDHNVNPQMFWCPMPRYKGCDCRPPNPHCI